jgi:hypothetical protein
MSAVDSGRPSGRRGLVLAVAAALGLLAFVVARCGPSPPLSIVCRHSDDPRGLKDFRVEVGHGKDQVRFADGLTLPVESGHDTITFLEKESNAFALNDNDGDEAALGVPSPEQRALGIPARVAPAVIHFDHRHDEVHRTTIDRRSLRFKENALTKRDCRGKELMDGVCSNAPA